MEAVTSHVAHHSCAGRKCITAAPIPAARRRVWHSICTGTSTCDRARHGVTACAWQDPAASSTTQSPIASQPRKAIGVDAAIGNGRGSEGAPQQQREAGDGGPPTTALKPPPWREVLMPILGRVAYRTVLYVARRLSWGSLKLNVLATNILFVLGVILVNYGVESALDHYLGDDPFGSLACILVGMGVMLWIKLYRVPLARKLIQTFWN